MIKHYCGDSVYATVDNRGLVLTTENGDPEPSNTIVLEPVVLQSLMNFLDLLRSQPAKYPTWCVYWTVQLTCSSWTDHRDFNYEFEAVAFYLKQRTKFKEVKHDRIENLEWHPLYKKVKENAN